MRNSSCKKKNQRKLLRNGKGWALCLSQNNNIGQVLATNTCTPSNSVINSQTLLTLDTISQHKVLFCFFCGLTKCQHFSNVNCISQKTSNIHSLLMTAHSWVFLGVFTRIPELRSKLCFPCLERLTFGDLGILLTGALAEEKEVRHSSSTYPSTFHPSHPKSIVISTVASLKFTGWGRKYPTCLFQ